MDKTNKDTQWHIGQLKITADDCKVLCQIIDLASTRGLFKAHELLPVGQIHAKMIRMIQEQQSNKPETSEKPKEPYIKDE